MIDGAHPSEQTIREVFRKLNSASAPRDVVAFTKWSKHNGREVGSVLRVLAHAEIVQVERRTQTITILQRAISRAALRSAHVGRKRELLRLERMQGYAYHRKCRRQYVMDYFGDNSFNKCGGCDNCSGALFKG